MAKMKDAYTAIISGSRKHANVIKKAVDGRQETVVGSRKRKRFNANRYKSLFIPQRIRIESDDKEVPERQDNSPQDNASTNGDVDKELKVQNSIRVQEAHDEAQKALLDELMDADQVEFVGRSSQTKTQDGNSTENGNVEKQIGGECSPSNRNADYDACANDNHIIYASSSRHYIENEQELDPCDKVTGTCKAAGVTKNAVNNDAATNVQSYGNISNSSKFVEFWVPVQLSNVQLEQYCATLLSNAMVLCCGSKDTVGGALPDIFISNRKCCNHPYVVDPTLHSKILKDQEPTMLKLDADIKASGKLQFLDLILPEVKKRQLRVLILFQSTTVTTKGVPSVGEMLFDFVHQRFGEDSYECVLTGLQPSARQTALNKFNKDMSIPFFLLEHRACHASIKLSSVDIIVIFDSDLTLANDLKSLQKISVDSQSEQIMIFRLYSSSTLEEKILKLAETNESRLHNLRSRYDALLKWGASDLFDRLTEFHRGSVFSISSEESFLKDVVEEFLYLISNKSESNDKSKSIIMRVQKFGIYGKNSETKTHLPYGDQPHIYWKKLLEGRLPIWKFVSFSIPRQRKRPHYLDGTTKGTSTEDGGGVKIRRKTVKPVIEGETGNVNEGGSGVPTQNEPQSSSSDRFQSTAVSNDKSLHDLLKASISELSYLLKLSDDVKIQVEKFLEFVLENYRLSSEHTSTLQALMISMCWIGSALQNIKIDRLESFDIAKKHLNFICQLEEAYSAYRKLQPAKEAFVQTERHAASKKCIPSPQRAKLDTEKSQHTKSYREEIHKFYGEWEEQRANLEKNYRMEQARIRSMHSNLSVRSKKMTQLKKTFVSKLEKHVKLREVYLKVLKAKQLTTKDGHPLHRPRDNSPEVGPSHDEPVDRINATEGDGLYDVELTGSHTSEKHIIDAMISSGPIGEVSTQHHDDIEKDVAREVDSPAVEHRNEAGSNDVVPHVKSPKKGVPAGNCNKEKAADGNIIPDTSNGGEDRRDSCSSSSNPPYADVSPEVTIPETDNQSLQVQDKQGPAGPNSLAEIVEYRPLLDAGQLGQIILEASSLDPHDEPSLIAENQSDMFPQTEILLEPICEQIPEAPTPPVSAEIQNPNTLSIALNMIDNVNHVAPLTPNHANPLQAEEERLRVAIKDVVMLQEETKKRLKSDCEKEIAKMAAEITLKYEVKCQEEEAAFHSKKKEIDANVKRAVMNKILAAAFRSMCQDLSLSGDAGKQQGSQTGLIQQLNRLSGSSHVRHSLNTSSISSSQSSGSQQTMSPQLSTLLSTSPPPPKPLALQSQPPLQIVHQPADLFSSQRPPNTNLATIPLTTSTTSRPPPLINPITPSSTANSLSAANQRVYNETLGQASCSRPPITNGEVRAPAPHMQSLRRNDTCAPAPHLQPRVPAPHIRPFRPTEPMPPDFANPRRMLPAQHVTSTPLTSPSNSQSPVLPPLSTSSTQPLLPPPPPPPPSSGSSPQPLPPLPPEPNVVPPPPPSSESSPQLPPEPNVVPPPPLSSESSPQPLPPLSTEPCVVWPPPGSSPQLLPPLPIEPYIVPPPPPSPPPSSIPATSSPVPNTSSDTTSPNVLSTPTSGKPSLTLTDNLNVLLNDNAALGNILPTTPDLSTHSTGPEFICLLDDE